MTRICLEMLRRSLAGFDAEVWVVDNGSGDESVAYLRSLDWIRLIEREPEGPEAGFLAHGQALNLIQSQCVCDYAFLMHTDTLVYDGTVFRDLFGLCRPDERVFVVGCLDQINRGWLRFGWRFVSRFANFQFRRAKQALGLPTKAPKPYRETHIKSFCALWNLRILRETGLRFLMADRIPGYEAQDALLAAGYLRRIVSARVLFRYVDHIEAGTVSANGGHSKRNRRVERYRRMVGRVTERGMN